jgi:hypothetical protein
VFAGLLPAVQALMEPSKPEMAVRDQRPHAARLGERQSPEEVGLAALGIEPVGMGRDVAEQVQRMGRVPGLTRRGFDRSVAQARASSTRPSSRQVRPSAW